MNTEQMWQELLEKCGWHNNPDNKRAYHWERGVRVPHWFDSKDNLTFDGRLPPPTMDNIFKYVIPEGYQQIIFQPDGYCGLTVNDELYEAQGDTPAEALIAACYKERM